jgi:hypothetical protein
VREVEVEVKSKAHRNAVDVPQQTVLLQAVCTPKAKAQATFKCPSTGCEKIFSTAANAKKCQRNGCPPARSTAATQAATAAKAKKQKPPSSPKYRGASWHKNNSKWRVATHGSNNRALWLQKQACPLFAPSWALGHRLGTLATNKPLSSDDGDLAVGIRGANPLGYAPVSSQLGMQPAHAGGEVRAHTASTLHPPFAERSPSTRRA